MRAFPVLVIAALAGCAPSTGPDAPAEITSLPRELTAAERDIISGTSHFAFGLLRQESARNPDRNVFISPLSASFALGMTANGSAAPTWDAMSATLGFGGVSRENMIASYRSLIDLLRSLDPRVTMQIANSIWYRNTFTVQPAFLDESRTHFDARVSAVDFSSPSAIATINAWVSENTKGKITKIIEDIPPDMIMYLINAIYFKGDWRDAFDRGDTRSEPFTKEDGSTVTVPMMHQKKTMGYTQTADAQVVNLPYGGGAYSMTIMVPAGARTARQLVAALDTAKWRSISSSFGKPEVDLAMPKFKLEFEDSLVAALKALGMSSGFCSSTTANFARINPTASLCIDLVKQKTFVEVNEEGTVAAAVTVVGIVETSAPQTQIVRVDRPFVVVISEKLSGTILFAGIVVAPPAA